LELTTAAVLSLPSSAAKLGLVIVTVACGVLIMNCGRFEIRESKAVPDRIGKKKKLEAALRLDRRKRQEKKKEGKGPVPSNEEGLKEREVVVGRDKEKIS
jgi:hypothetical protein